MKLTSCYYCRQLERRPGLSESGVCSVPEYHSLGIVNLHIEIQFNLFDIFDRLGEIHFEATHTVVDELDELGMYRIAFFAI